jgi:hypothetical protein
MCIVGFLFTQEKDSSLSSYFDPWLARNEPNPVSREACYSMAYSSICQEYAADLSQCVRQTTPLCAVFIVVLNCVLPPPSP